MSATQPAPNASSIGKHNQGVMDSITQAKRIAVILARHGCTVYDVIATVRNARIIIKQPVDNAPLTRDAAPIKYCPAGITMAANIDGVQIEWTIRRVP